MIRKISREIVQFAVCVGVCVCTNVLVHNCFAAKFEKKIRLWKLQNSVL